MGKLMTTRQISRLRDGIFTVGGVVGLYVRKRNGVIRYFMRWSHVGVRHDHYLPRNITLTEARKLGAHCRYQIDRGNDPRIEKLQNHIQALSKVESLNAEAARLQITFQSVTDEWIAYQRDSGVWKHNDTGERSTYNRLKRYAFPIIGRQAIHSVSVKDIVKVLTPIWSRQAVADKLYYSLRRIFAYAIANGYYTQNNPLDKNGSLGVLLQPLTIQRTEGGNRAALPYERVPDFIKCLIDNGSTSALAFAFSILTASRFKAVRLATWEEFDLRAPIPSWEIPINHDKNKTKGLHSVLLSPEAIFILGLLNNQTEIVFSTKNGRALTDAVTSRLVQRLNKKQNISHLWVDPNVCDEHGNPKPITQHGTARASFRTYFASDDRRKRFDSEAVEMCLLHKVKPLNGAYDRASLIDERYAVMCEWGRYCFEKLLRNGGDCGQ